MVLHPNRTMRNLNVAYFTTPSADESRRREREPLGSTSTDSARQVHSMTDKMFPAGSLNHATLGPPSW
jgi:hypothetical protein